MGSEGVTEEMVTEEGVEEGGGKVGECPVEGVTEEGVTDVGVGERDVETGEGARSVGVCSEGSLGLYMDGGRGMSARLAGGGGPRSPTAQPCSRYLRQAS